MTYASELMILSLRSSFAYFISLTILHLSFACLLRNAEMLTVCQSLHRKSKGNSVPKQEEDGDAGTLYFLNIGIGLQQLAQVIH